MEEAQLTCLTISEGTGKLQSTPKTSTPKEESPERIIGVIVNGSSFIDSLTPLSFSTELGLSGHVVYRLW